MSKDPNPKKRRLRKPKMVRVLVTLPQNLLDMADRAAEEDYTTRSELVRTALRLYLRPQGRDLAQTNPDEIYKTLRDRRLGAGLKKILKNTPH